MTKNQNIGHNYKNPSKKRLDLIKVEAGGDDDGFGFAGAKTIIDANGWRQRAPVSDRECIRQALFNSIGLCGLDKEQVKRLYRKYGGKKIL
tara:strand:+ start:292 stop:564 length:273 start_codon:yes stop_codon:yes gene_type:complete